MSPQQSSTSFRDFVRRKTFRLNGAYLLTTLGDRMWMFAIGIFMHKLGGMTWVAVQQFFDALVKLAALPIIGSIMDKRDRNKIMQISLVVNNIAVGASAAAFFLCFYLPSPDGTLTGNRMALFIVGILFASISRVASEAQRICFTKDWTVVITSAYPEEGVTLSNQNSLMSVIDQSSSVILPVFTGALIEISGYQTSCIFIIAYNVVSWYIESNILRNLYNLTPALKKRCVEKDEDGEENQSRSFSWINSFRLYFQQSSWMAGFGLALLYMTVLGFDNLAGSYGQKHGMHLVTLGFLRTTGSLLGVLGAITFGRLEPRIGLLWTAFIGLTWQNIFINFCSFSTILPGSPMNIMGYISNFDLNIWIKEVNEHISKPTNDDHFPLPFLQLPPSILVFFFGITLARFGLWMADPAITQIQQETIPESQRYSVFAMQTAFCEAFSLLKDTIIILFPNTELFGALAIASCIFVFAGYMFNNAYFLKCGCSSAKDAHLRKPVKTSGNPEIELAETGKLLDEVKKSEEEQENEENEQKMEKNGDC
ncbi:unnamed protein product [Caenorhabditis angaria]|uniref:Solute carrier family 40 member n=1 Tax=Caenorhabditis angaria TaxID=860376 RepID=A0A9P1I7D6_9PELO|nr:unnamed protein product [Caenorhabditis angaria]